MKTSRSNIQEKQRKPSQRLQIFESLDTGEITTLCFLRNKIQSGKHHSKQETIENSLVDLKKLELLEMKNTEKLKSKHDRQKDLSILHQRRGIDSK